MAEMLKITKRGARCSALTTATALSALLATAAPAGAQDAIAVSPLQFGADTMAVAETNLRLDVFGGGDENGGLFGGAPSLAVPLGDNFGVQFDGMAGFVADEAGFAGGAGQLFYRDPQVMTVGIAGGGYIVEDDKQYAVAAIGEYYLSSVTLELLAGYQWGDIVHDSYYARAGATLYVNPNFKIGAGIGYAEDTEISGDLQIEALLSDVPGLALFANGSVDEKGALALAGVRLYTAAAELTRTKSAGEVTLMDIDRRYQRPNFLTGYGSMFGLRQASLAGGGVLPPSSGGGGNGGNGGNGGGGNGGGGNGGGGNGGGGQTSNGLISLVQNTVENLLGNTPLQGVSDLVNALVDPQTGVLSPLTGALEAVTDTATGALGGLTNVVDALAGPKNGVLDPVLDGVNDLLTGDTRSTTTGGLIDVVQGTVGSLLDNTPLAFVGNLVDTLVDPQTGALAALTGPLNDLTDIQTGGLGAVTEVVDALVGDEKGALDPTLDGLNHLLSGQTESTNTGGLIDTVQGTVNNLLGGTILSPVAGLVNTLVDPQTGALAALTDPLNDLTNVQTGGLGAVTEVVDTLVGANNGALDPTLDGVNHLLSF
ncbi:hypothetical protein [Zavarzinia aquatilis]|nr:hypothetical protein [Zavarzinia aquatilis]